MCVFLFIFLLSLISMDYFPWTTDGWVNDLPQPQLKIWISSIFFWLQIVISSQVMGDATD